MFKTNILSSAMISLMIFAQPIVFTNANMGRMA